MKRLLVPAALALALAAGVVVAQTPTTPPPDGQKHAHHLHDPQKEAQHLSKALNLTPDQTAKLAPILADRDQKMAALRGDGQAPPPDARKQMHAIQKSTIEQLATILTPDQLQQMKSMHHGHGEHGRHGQGTQPLTPQA